MTANARPMFRRIRAVVLGGLVLTLVLIPLVVLAAAPIGPLRIGLDPATALMGTPFTFAVTGLKPGERVVIKGHTIDSQGRAWNSQAEFIASTLGVVDVAIRPGRLTSFARKSWDDSRRPSFPTR